MITAYNFCLEYRYKNKDMLLKGDGRWGLVIIKSESLLVISVELTDCSTFLKDLLFQVLFVHGGYYVVNHAFQVNFHIFYYKFY